MMGRWYEAFLGLRYLRASPKRGFVSLIAGIAILGLALGVAVLIVVLSVMNGFEGELRTRILSVTAHATISGVDGEISNWRADLKTVERVPGVAAASPYIEEQALMAHAGKSSGVLMRGVLPDQERRVADLGPHLESGRLADLLPGSYRVILGKALAETLRAKVGDRVILMVPEGDVTPIGVLPRMRAFRVDGILSIGMYEYDRRVALVAMQDAATLLRMGGDVTGLRLSVTDPYAAPGIVRDAAVALPKGAEDYLVNDWTEEHVNFFRSIEITKHMLFVILSLMVAVAAFNIVSTMVMVVKDKRRDIAILRTFGSSPRSILSVFIVQGSLIGGLGIAGGLLVGVLVATNLEQMVHALEHVLGFKFLDARVYFMSDLPAYVQLGDLVRICGVAFVLACISTIYPAWRAARLLPAESLRND
ncbi:MAG TPA: lipoprotein-releasing ABC transporter permease subunit [Steroidobacteraceae bacterium]|jgi:lipoprotein-releasing system permease protein|nr:lipoprotein-releasing ABC transporter permease subunit [Steroidobacteraceae bacterium]